MSTKLTGFGGAGTKNMAAMNIASGDETVNLASGQSRSVDYFADEEPVTNINKREAMRISMPRQLSVSTAVCGCLSLFFVIFLFAKVLGGKNPVSKEEGSIRYDLMLEQLEPLTGATIAESGTPEEAALTWLAYSDPAQLDPDAHLDLLTQRFVLATLYLSTNGADWDEQHHFMTYLGTCDWNQMESGSVFGASCNSDGFVSRLVLPDISVSGSLPRDIGLLTHLTHLDMSSNKIGGNLPSTIGMLNKLTHLDLRSNQFTGFAPNNAQKLSSLEQFHLSDNRFDGEIPYQYLIDLPKVKIINLKNNMFSGIVHDDDKELWGIETLVSLDLSNNSFEGQMPGFLSEITSLQSIDFSNNAFTGTIPAAYAEMERLATFIFNHNRMAGSIPEAFGSNDVGLALEIFVGNNNQLVGSIPSSFGNFPILEILDLGKNGLSHGIPSEFGDLSVLQVLRLNNNTLTGTIPSEIGRCKALIELDFANNKLAEQIPTDIGELGSLVDMDLSNNDLVGSIPTEFKNMPDLRSLYLNGNTLIGAYEEILCDRPSDYPSWLEFSANCLESDVSCSCCTRCCDTAGSCCDTSSSSCSGV
eukprot:Nitzschia sp. Nitz4//scaffold14_size191712//112655//114940//NITZ4_001731-RA/size191712-augustus-gene-0.247-mRNA-1//-1//CDS//3329536951//3674//frame0